MTQVSQRPQHNAAAEASAEAGGAPREPFSVLLPVWGGDRPEWLREAFRSTILEQTVRPDQLVIVRDGPVGERMANLLDELVRTSPVPVTRVDIEHNGGLGPALDQGLDACLHDVVARMDADDIAMPHRFATQLPLMADADIVGAGLLEFGTGIDDVVGQRVPPVEPAAILAYARVHDPFNHPTVIYRRAAVRAVGGYGDLPMMEDYALFARMLAAGARPRNVAEPLVYYRVGAVAFKRRGGRELLRSELRLQRQFRDQGFVTAWQYRRNVVIRGGYRLVPWWMRRVVYRLVVIPYSARRSAGRMPIPAQHTTQQPTQQEHS